MHINGSLPGALCILCKGMCDGTTLPVSFIIPEDLYVQVGAG